ncbi:MAG: hypothetical protein QNJ22_15705 [Desulfosarcinaceae bacterium]|nr:hypothetical protein [Desulfosarcinaceae bacterium]
MTRYSTQLLILVAGIGIACGLGMRSAEAFRTQLVFKAAPAIVVDAFWEQGAATWTHADGDIRRYSQPSIVAIKPHDIPVVRSGLELLAAQLWQLRWRAFVLLNTHCPLNRTWPPRHLDLLLAGLAMLFLIAIATFLRRQGPLGEGGTAGNASGQSGILPGTGAQPGGSVVVPGILASESDPTPQEQIVAFFLQLFQAQCAPGRQGKARFTASGVQGPHGTTVYDLQVHIQGKYHRRRMSIGPLGPGRVGSSLCFFVIYDVHLVVKLPRTPITNYTQYIESIDRERQIAALLKGIPAIIPRVTTVLENVHRFGDHDHLSADAVERRYIAWMRRNPAFQRYVKIGDSFAFFMELSSHHFLHHVFDDIHLTKNRQLEEVRDYGHLIWKPHEFIGRYGAAAQPVCAQLQGVYQNCRRSLDLPTPPGQPSQKITDYQYRKAFLSGLADLLRNDGRQEPALTTDQISAMRSQVAEQVGVVNHYRRTLRRYLRKTLFLHNRQQLAALAANTFHMTAWLYDRRIALRDLKPENLLVVGERDNFPAFLERADRFQLGLIDLETATAQTSLDDDAALLSPPKPGGTPLYATPSHFLTVDSLRQIYPHPFDVLMEQDWHAAIAISFRIVTGAHLWDGSAGLFPAMVEMIANTDPEADQTAFANLFSKLSWVFWSNARMEFHDKLRKHRSVLNKVKLYLSPESVATILQRIEWRIGHLNDEMTALLNAHEKLGEVVRHLQLTNATSEQIRLLRTTWEMDATTDSKQAFLLSDRFRELEGLTQNLEALSQGRELFERYEDGIDLLPLLNLLFAHCLSVMYKGEWKGLGHRRIDWHEALMDEPSYTQTL